MALYGRHGESPLPIVAPATPAGCFHAAIEAARIAVKYRTPVIVLSDTFLANSSEPWLVPSAADLPQIDPNFATKPNTADGDFLPYLRDESGARPWAVPGTPGLEHRIGGLEKDDVSGDISYEPENHQRMTDLRAAKIAGIDVPDLEVDDPSGEAELLVLGWGSTYGPIGGAVRRIRPRGGKVATAHLQHLSPLPANTGDVLRRYSRVFVPEANMGQLVKVVRAEFLVDAESFTKVEGVPFFTEDLEAAIEERIR
jgi:2-oxoglutarate ferredoxin oxidoreductase subunit alpha